MTDQEKVIKELRDEVAALKESETSASAENKSMTGQLSDLRLQLERLVYESKEAAITSDAMKEQNADLAGELEELRVRLSSSHAEDGADCPSHHQKSMNDLKISQKSVTQEGKDKKKAEKMAAMMAGLDTVIRLPLVSRSPLHELTLRYTRVECRKRKPRSARPSLAWTMPSPPIAPSRRRISLSFDDSSKSPTSLSARSTTRASKCTRRTRFLPGERTSSSSGWGHSKASMRSFWVSCASIYIVRTD